MKEIDYTLVFKNALTGEEIKDVKGDAVTLQHILFQCASQALQGDENLPIADKMRLHSAANKVVKLEKLKATELEKLRERGAKFLSIMAFGFVATQIAEALGEEQEVA